MSNDFEGIFEMELNDTNLQKQEPAVEEEEETCTLHDCTPDENEIFQKLAKEVEERRSALDFQLLIEQIVNGTSRSFDDSDYLIALQRTQKSISCVDDDD